MNKLNPLNPHPNNIWNFEQNKPSLIAKDLYEIHGVPIIDTLKILLSRGVFKWFAVRRDLIKQKDIWKEQIKKLHIEQKKLKELIKKDPENPSLQFKYGIIKGYKKALEQCRAEIRAMCHSERWRVPDFDRKALEMIEEEMKKNQSNKCNKEKKY